MERREIALTCPRAPERVETAVQRAAEAVSAQVTLTGTLKSYPGSRHWHIQAPPRRGTVEVTFWPERNALWVSVHANRMGEWAGEAASALAEALEQILREPG